MSKIFVPQPMFNKREIFKTHTALLSNLNSKVLLIGDSLIANLCFFPDTWKDHFSRYDALNLGVAGDKVENVRWRVQNIEFPETTSHILISCWTNNIEVTHP